MLQNAYLDAKIGFDPAENELLKRLERWSTLQSYKFPHAPPVVVPRDARSNRAGVPYCKTHKQRRKYIKSKFAKAGMKSGRGQKRPGGDAGRKRKMRKANARTAPGRVLCPPTSRTRRRPGSSRPLSASPSGMVRRWPLNTPFIESHPYLACGSSSRAIRNCQQSGEVEEAVAATCDCDWFCSIAVFFFCAHSVR